MKPLFRLLDRIAARFEPRREPNLYQRCLAVHLQASVARSALSS